VHNFIQSPDPRIFCDTQSEIEDGESLRGAVASRRKNRFQEDPKTRPGSESRQPEAKEPVVLRDGFWTRHALISSAVSKCKDDGHFVRTFME
jgi:hypothetical protein